MKERKYSGHWWIDGEKDNTISGELFTYEGSMPELQLNGAFRPNERSQSTISTNKIHGRAGNDLITLSNCQRNKISNQTDTFGTSIESEWVAQYCTIGHPYYNQNIALDELYVEFEGVGDWIRFDGLDMDMDIQNPPIWSSGDKATIEYTQPDSVDAWIDGEKISVSLSMDSNHERGEQATIKLKNRFKISPNRPRVPLSDYFPTISKLQNFVSFGASGSVAKKEIGGKIQGDDVEILIPENAETDIESHPHRMLFTLPDIESNFAKVLSNWDRITTEYQEIIDLYSAASYNPGMYPRNELQNYVHSLESYHRQKWGNEYMHPWTFSYFLKDIKDILKGNPSNVYSGASHPLREMYNVPDSMVQSLSYGALKYSNEYSLRKRLSEIVDAHRSTLKGLPFSIVDKVGLATDTRNYFAHYTEELRKKAVTSGPELQKLVWGVKQLIEVCLLDELGMPEDYIKSRLESKYQNKFVNPV
ncbi:hypothetical protein HYG81_15825 [Natrinema zhouii]|uniref:Uncharacterized protein n=1 Tax=Natrinema zhouii TaxID=1710539 RepID=A0A7D6CQF5_9EURY|nr:HEPN domain-containing protein [Natrinema zhouii]QLK25533.1 hypothetical protein HYG81_15825 [Natrinema zhouii]